MPRILTHTGKAKASPIGTNEVQSVSVTNATGGTFTLTFAGQTTAPIAHNANAATVEAALEALSNLAPADVACAGGALGAAPVTVTFGGAYEAENVAQMTADGSSLTGGGSQAVAVTTPTSGLGDDTLVYTLLGKRKRLDQVGASERVLDAHGRAHAKSTLVA